MTNLSHAKKREEDATALSHWNRTEALDSSRAAVRDKKITLPRRLPIVEQFAKHTASDAKVLEEDPDTGAKKYRYIRTGVDHFSLAFTYAWMAANQGYGGPRIQVISIPRETRFPFDRTFPPIRPFGRGWPFR